MCRFVRGAPSALLILGACNDRLLAGGFEQVIELLFDPSKVTFGLAFAAAFPHRAYNTINGIPETVPIITVRWLSLCDFRALCRLLAPLRHARLSRKSRFTEVDRK
jgi:hypothetical protein